MAHITDDRVLESTTTTGTGALTLAGALTGFKTFASAASVNDTCWYALWAVDGSGNATGDYEEGLGTYTTTSVLTRTTVLKSSNTNSVVTLAAGTKYVCITALASKVLQLDNDSAIVLPGSATNPAAPAADYLKQFAKKLGGRMLPAMMGPAGTQSFLQPALFSKTVNLYLPGSGSTLGLNYGTPWLATTTISHPTPATTAPAIVNQMKRTRLANTATTTNQVVGLNSMASNTQQFWRGNAAGLGGFFFFCRFIVELWPAATVRLFVGLSDQTTAVVTSDTLAGNLCGLTHITSEAASVLNFTTRDGSTASSTAITLATNLAAGQAFEFYMYAKPNDSNIYYRVDEINGGTTLVDSVKTTNLPTATAFMGPQIAMSNGTANTTVTTTGIGINCVYIESDH